MSRSSTECCREWMVSPCSGEFGPRTSRLPVLLLTALGRIEDRVEGPGSRSRRLSRQALRIFRARSPRECARRGAGRCRSQPTRLEQRGCQWICSSAGSREATPVHLQPREFRILEELMREAGKIVTRTMLLERVWGYHFDPQTNIVETHISRFARSSTKAASADPIETVRGVGYRLPDDA